jgi:hypothetical protein
LANGNRRTQRSERYSARFPASGKLLKHFNSAHFYQLPYINRPSSFTGFFLAFFAATVFADSSPIKRDVRLNQSPAPAVVRSPASKQGLNFVLGAHGLNSLSFNGQSFLSSPESGALQQEKSVFRTLLDTLLPHSTSPSTAPTRDGDTVDLVCRWGRISCAYGKQDNRLTMRIEVSNTSSEPLNELSLRLMELNFPSIPHGGTLEAGMFGFGFKGPEWQLHEGPLSIPSVADPRFVVPIINMSYGSGALAFCSDDVDCAVDVPESTNFPARTSYPFIVTCRDIKPGTTRVVNISLRFGTAGARIQDLAGDVLERYAGTYPFQVDWKDRRPIGAIFLAGSQINRPTNPRRWIMNSGDIDVAYDKGKAAFRAALLKLADNSIEVLKATGAQGMITWDPEGEEFLSECYYGDPRLVPALAPEMEFKNDGVKSAIDEYFEKFRAAGLKVGVCIRPQQITIVGGWPVHQAAEDEQAAQILRERIAYAKQRWGCTLFYVDSTATINGALNPDVFKAVADPYPDVLLIPENESMRYFAYSAPLNSYVHHKITSTPVGARLVYPKAFSVLMAPEGDRPEDHDALVSAVRRGDILLFNSWFMNEGALKIKKIYEEAHPKQAVHP